jgi:YaiO family outer membrane protein
VRFRTAFLFGAVLTAAAFAAPPEDRMAAARREAEAARFSAALAQLDTLLAAEPGHFEARLFQARIHSWQGRYGTAHRELSALDAERPDDAEVGLAQAYLLYYQTRLDESWIAFQTLVAAHPGNADAREGLDRVRRARSLSGRPWRLDAGGEYSVFTGREQPAWGQAFVQAGRAVNAAGTMPYARLEYWRQFERSDVALEAGVSHRFSDKFNGTLAAAWNPDADFKPDWRFVGDAGFRLYGPTGPGWGAWLLASAWYDLYAATEILRTSPGLRVEWGPFWAVTGRLARIDESGEDPLYGWSGRLDGPLPAGLRFYGGYGDAPETVAATTVATRTIFAGLFVPLGSSRTLTFGYTRDDRENAYIRHAFNASLSQRF